MNRRYSTRTLLALTALSAVSLTGYLFAIREYESRSPLIWKPLIPARFDLISNSARLTLISFQDWSFVTPPFSQQFLEYDDNNDTQNPNVRLRQIVNTNKIALFAYDFDLTVSDARKKREVYEFSKTIKLQFPQLPQLPHRVELFPAFILIVPGKDPVFFHERFTSGDEMAIAINSALADTD